MTQKKYDLSRLTENQQQKVAKALESLAGGGLCYEFRHQARALLAEAEVEPPPTAREVELKILAHAKAVMPCLFLWAWLDEARAREAAEKEQDQ